MKKIKFGVIGCGAIARKRTIQAINDLECSELVAVFDINKNISKKIAEKYSVDKENNIESLLNRSDINVVYIATPIGTHYDIALMAAKYKKHILCEKSLTINLQQTVNLIKTCKENDVALLEGFMYQFHSQHKTVKNIINNGTIGKPILFQAWFGFPPLPLSNFRYSKELGGGAILDAGAYVVHSARTFFNREPSSITSCISHDDNPVEIHGTVLMDFGESQTATLTFGFDNFYRNSYSIWGTKGIVTLKRAFSLPADFKPELIVEKQDYKEVRILPACDHFKEEVKFFVENINDSNVREHWYNDALNQAKILDEIKK